MVLKLYGLEASQPFRSVQWVLEMKNVPYEIVRVVPGGRKEEPLGTLAASFRAMNPAGTVPFMVDTDNKVSLAESNAILTYISDKYGFNDLFPKDTIERARVTQWLHWMHHNSRMFSYVLFAPLFRSDFQPPSKGEQATKLAHLASVCKLLDNHLAKSAFLAGDSVTLADIAVFADIGQMRALKLFDFSEYRNLSRWMDSMTRVPKYDKCHAIFDVLHKVLDKKKAKSSSENASVPDKELPKKQKKSKL